MATVRFTQHLARFFPALEQDVEVPGATVSEIVRALEDKYPGMGGYLVDDQGALRQHVNIFIGNEIIHDQKRLTDKVEDTDKIFVLQALSGG